MYIYMILYAESLFAIDYAETHVYFSSRPTGKNKVHRAHYPVWPQSQM